MYRALAALLAPVTLLLPRIGGILALIAEFVLFFALLGALFDLDESDTWYCLWVMVAMRIGIYFALMAVFSR